jgi:hypothetical protein
MLNRSENRPSRIWRITAVWVPASIFVWVVYALVVSLIGGKNVVYGPSWLQWNYARWMLAPHDLGFHYGDALRVCFFFLFAPAFFSTEAATFIFSTGTDCRTEHSVSRRLYAVGGALTIMCFGLPMLFSGRGGSCFWWPTPRTVIPASTVRLFEIATTVFWFASPFLAYWITVSFLRLRWKRRHGVPSGTFPVEEPRVG